MAKKKSNGGNIALVVIVVVILHVFLMLNFEPYAELWDMIYRFFKDMASR